MTDSTQFEGMFGKISRARRSVNSNAKKLGDSALSLETRILLKQMMKSSKLSHSQQKYLDGMVDDNGFVPYSDATPKPTSRVSLEAYNDAQKASKAIDKLIWFKNPPQKRSKQQIVESGEYTVEKYRTIPKKNMNIEKVRFQKSLECSGQEPVAEPKIIIAPPAEEYDEFTQIEKEIDERRQWLDDMISLGRGDTYKRQIQAEIKQRLSRLEVIHKERKARGA